jgi:hypothetical protein
VTTLALRVDRRLGNLGGALQQVSGMRSLLRGRIGVDRRSKARARAADVDGPALDTGRVARVARAKGALDGLEQAKRRVCP